MLDSSWPLMCAELWVTSPTRCGCRSGYFERISTGSVSRKAAWDERLTSAVNSGRSLFQAIAHLCSSVPTDSQILRYPIAVTSEDI